MSVGSDAADQVVRESIQITESAVKLAGLGAKNLAAMVLALMREMHQTKQAEKRNKVLQKDGVKGGAQ